MRVSSMADAMAVDAANKEEITWNLQDLGGGNWTCTFKLAAKDAARVPDAARGEIFTRGGRFAIESGSMPGTVCTTFLSPMPDVTAKSIAERIQHRMNLPSVGSADVCSIC